MARFDCFMLKSLPVAEYGRTWQDLKRARAVFRPLFLIYCYRDDGGGGAGRAIARLPLFYQRFQESNALRPDWRLALVHQGTPKLPRINLEGSVMRLLILLSALSISALIRKATAPTHRWRPFWLKLLMVTTMRNSSSFLKPHTAKMLIRGR